MIIKRQLFSILGYLSIGVAIIFLVSCGLMTKPSMGDVQETWETSNQAFNLRVNRHSETNGGFVPGAYYVYQTAPKTSDNWQTIFIQRHDDPNPIQRNSTQFIDSQVGYVFFGQKYAVTMDAGENWIVWDAWEADKIMQFKQYRLYPSIQEVSIESNGYGRMRLYSTTDKSINQPELITLDYGRNWNLE